MLFSIPVLLFIGIFFKLYSKWKYRYVFGLIGLIWFTSLGYYLYANTNNTLNKSAFLNNREHRLIAVIQEPLADNEKYYFGKIYISHYLRDTIFCEINIKALAYFKKGNGRSKPKVSEEFLVQGRLYPFDSPEYPKEFDYAWYQKCNGIMHKIYLDDSGYTKIHTGKSNSLYLHSQQIREKLLNYYRMFDFSPEQIAVLSALTLGYRAELDTELKASFFNAGAMHVLAVSGLHVGILYLILNYILFFLNKRKATTWIKVAIIICLLWCFAWISGLSPSVRRAVILFSFITIGHTAGKKISNFNLLFVAAFINLLFFPMDLYTVGFQLSYAAVFSIIWLYPYLNHVLYFKPVIIRKIWSSIAVAIAAQLGVLPIILFYFHQFPVYFWLSAILVIPMAGIILALSVCFIGVYSIPVISLFMAKIIKFVLLIFISSIEFIGKLPGATINHISIDKIQAVFLALIILSLCTLIVYKYRYMLILLLMGVVCYQGHSIYRFYTKITHKKILITEDYSGKLLINYVCQQSNHIITESEDDSYANLLYRLENFWLTTKAKRVSYIETFETVIENNKTIENSLNIYCINGNYLLNANGWYIYIVKLYPDTNIIRNFAPDYIVMGKYSKIHNQSTDLMKGNNTYIAKNLVVPDSSFSSLFRISKIVYLKEKPLVLDVRNGDTHGKTL